MPYRGSVESPNLLTDPEAPALKRLRLISSLRRFVTPVTDPDFQEMPLLDLAGSAGVIVIYTEVSPIERLSRCYKAPSELQIKLKPAEFMICVLGSRQFGVFNEPL